MFPPDNSKTYEKIPFCFEEIQDEAKKCKHCGSMVDGGSREQSVANSVQQTYVTNAKVGKKAIIWGSILAVIGIMVVIGGASDTSGTNNAPGIIIGVLMAIVGIIIMMVGKIKHWYHWK